MADDVTLNAGSGGDTVAADAITKPDGSIVKVQRIKLVRGIDGDNDGDVSRVLPLPVEMSMGVLVDLMRELILEVRGLRLATVALVTEAGHALDSDFDPAHLS